ncbi:MAG: hypothetical protein NZ893_00575 [Candidatus Aenigmarchaeota archaeon]|nr:hypothetical protein [Candidatus Aenigmarchaeota archaeon]
MANPFRVLVERLAETGIYDFLLPMIIFWAIMYGLLRKSKIFGDAEAIYAVLTFAFSLFIWGYAATLPEMSIGRPLSFFTAQFFVIVLVFLFSFVAASIAYPNFTDALKVAFEGKTTLLWVFLVIFIILFFIAGLNNILNLQTIYGRESGGAILLILFLFIGLVIAVTSVAPSKS